MFGYKMSVVIFFFAYRIFFPVGFILLLMHADFHLSYDTKHHTFSADVRSCK